MTEVFYLSDQTYLFQQTFAGNSCKQGDVDISVGFFLFSSIPQVFPILESTDRRVGSFVPNSLPVLEIHDEAKADHSVSSFKHF